MTANIIEQKADNRAERQTKIYIFTSMEVFYGRTDTGSES